MILHKKFNRGSQIFLRIFCAIFIYYRAKMRSTGLNGWNVAKELSLLPFPSCVQMTAERVEGCLGSLGRRCSSSMKVKGLAPQSGLTLCDPHGPARLLHPWILQARLLEWVAIPFSRGPFQTRGQTRVSSIRWHF